MSIRCHLFFLALLVAAVPGMADTRLGRIFYSPEERQALDAGVKKSDPRSWQASGDPTSVSLDGYVLRPRKNSTVWLNGEARRESAPPGFLIDGKEGTVRVHVRGTAIALKPGQSWDGPQPPDTRPVPSR